MECTILRTSDWFGIAPEPPCIGAKKNEEGKWYIEINTLDELIKLSEQCGHPIIIDPFSNFNLLEIYDRYRE